MVEHLTSCAVQLDQSDVRNCATTQQRTDEMAPFPLPFRGPDGSGSRGSITHLLSPPRCCRTAQQKRFAWQQRKGHLPSTS